jgi:hypothetical protein
VCRPLAVLLASGEVEDLRKAGRSRDDDAPGDGQSASSQMGDVKHPHLQGWPAGEGEVSDWLMQGQFQLLEYGVWAGEPMAASAVTVTLYWLGPFIQPHTLNLRVEAPGGIPGAPL